MFNWFKKSSIEAKSLTNPTDDEMVILTGGVVGGVSLSIALTVPAVQSAIRIISEAAASLDIAVMRINDDGSEEKDTSHQVSRLLADQPNEWTSTFELIRDLVATALTQDRGGVAFVNRVGDEVREIIRYEPSYVTVDFSADGRQEPSYRIANRPIPASDIIHLRSPFGRSPLALAADAINTAKIMETHAGNLFRNGARPSGVIEFPKSLGDEGLKKMKAGWKNAHEGPENSGRTAILWDGASFRPITLTSVDAQFLELRGFQILEIARAFRIPPPMLYDLSRATWSNGEQQGKEFLSYSLEPWLKVLEGAMRRALFSAEDRPRYRIVFDRDDLTRADLTARATAISSLISAKVINPNEGREWLGLAPYIGGEAFSNPHITTGDKPSDPVKETDNG
ncbi:MULTISPECIES: phage portal protein [unclassified Shinella]|uniref:phage portal protein n=1 Tax=unclassified Shinella TaxID=2643062 RepID=UPI00225D137E|nr:MULTISPECIES: phage portal protein [unclassified Shinella]MCO5139285.1 phage portal protein [Shinella sp.]MDC7255986.1 phage portal protein [Shinella sp. YE25]CAI0338822.1 Phage portal protein, HK97 family [Rhizobiaceae bacterium]CAK7257253.1 Phage portal protein, HK97 family [Shinella sp. WSC3-e]